MINRKAEIEEALDHLSDLSLWGLTEEQAREQKRLEDELKLIEGYEALAEKAKVKETSQRVKKAQQRGRNAEYQCAKDTHGVRVGRSKAVKVGDKYIQVNCQQPPEVLAAFFSFECKNTKLAKSVVKAVSQSIRNAPEGFSPDVWWYNPEDGVTYIFTTRPILLDEHFR